MRRLVLVASLVLVAALVAVVADLGIRRSLYLGVATALWPIEPDSRERALIIAAGSGDVSTVRSLLARASVPSRRRSTPLSPARLTRSTAGAAVPVTPRWRRCFST
jgi:hypothetical protein